MDFVSCRIITADVARLVAFYERVTGLTARRFSPDFAELPTPTGLIAIGSEQLMVKFQAGAAHGGANQSAILEFRVADVDKTFADISDAIGEPVQPPTTMFWGNRSLLFRDPDGNLVNFFTPVTAEAAARQHR
jgi:catechol 2,3-dioxygenase-like lactoylglutathione lyase family enzyme